MSTINEVIAKVEDDMSRQDLSDRLLAQIPQCIMSAHGLSTFRRDMLTKSVSGFTNTSNIVVLSTVTHLPKLKKPKSIRQFSSFTLDGAIVVPGTEILPGKFVDLSDANSEFNYYGFGYTQSFTLLGSALTIKGVDASALALSVTGNFWPSYTYNSLSGEYESDSWILLEFPQMVEAYLRYYVAKITKDKDLIKAEENNILMVRGELLTNYAGDIVS